MQNDKDPKGAQLSVEDTGMVKQRLGMGAPVGRFDPYQGAMTAKPPSRKRDLRKVGEWLEAKKRAERLKKDEADHQYLAGPPADNQRLMRTGLRMVKICTRCLASGKKVAFPLGIRDRSD
jgi:hypothetical protein